MTAKSCRQNRREVKRSDGLKRRGKKLAHESESIVIALPCQICEELCPSDKLIDHQLQRRKERENTKRSELKDTSFEAQEFAFNECSTGDSLLVLGVRCIEVQRGHSPTIESEMIVTLVTLPMICMSGQLAKQFFHAVKSELASCL